MVGYACLFIESLSADRVGAYCIRLTKRYQRWRGTSRFRPLLGRLWGVCNTPLRPGTCEGSKNGSVYATVGGVWWGVCNTLLRLGTCAPSKYRCNSLTGYVQLFKKLSRFRPLRGRLWGVCDTPLRLGMCSPSKNCPVFVPFWAACGAYAIRPYNRVRARVQKMDLYMPPSVAYGGAYAIRPYDRVRAALQKTIPFSSPSGPSVGRMQYAPTIGYMRSFEIPMQFSNWVRVKVQKMDLYTPPSVAYGGAYAIRPYDRVCARVQKMDLYTLPSVTSGGAYAIRPYNWVRAILRNTDAISQAGTCGPSKNCPVFVPFGIAGWVYAIRPYNRVRAALQKTILFSSPSVRMVGVCDTLLRLGTCEGSKNGSVYATVGGVWWGVCNTLLQPGTCDPSKYRCNPPTGYVCPFEISVQHPNWVRMILWNTDAISQLSTCNPSKY